MTVQQLFDRVFQASPDRPLRTFWRSTGYRIRPPRPVVHEPRVTARQDHVLAAGARSDQRAEILYERRPGPTTTVILGGFVPDPTEALYLQRGMLLRHGSVYYVGYPCDGFSLPLLIAQLEDLIDEIAKNGRPPILIGVSFGCGVLIEWMRHLRRAGQRMRADGVILISPVTCPADILGQGRPSTLLGRALQPFMPGSAACDESHVEKCRKLLLRMFEAGAKNRRSIRLVMTEGELLRVRHRVMTTLRSITARGAAERVAALMDMEPPSGYFTQLLRPLCSAPVLVLFAEKESSVLAETAPTSAAFGSRPSQLFPCVQVRTVVNRRGDPVQHASLLFHCFNFSPHLSSFYRMIRERARLERKGPPARSLRSWWSDARVWLQGERVA